MRETKRCAHLRLARATAYNVPPDGCTDLFDFLLFWLNSPVSILIVLTVS